MTRKRKTFSATKAVKAAAREHLGTPPPARVAPGKEERALRKEKKHKATVKRLLDASNLD